MRTLHRSWTVLVTVVLFVLSASIPGGYGNAFENLTVQGRSRTGDAWEVTLEEKLTADQKAKVKARLEVIGATAVRWDAETPADLQAALPAAPAAVGP